MTLATHARKKRGDTRTKMLISAAEVMRERGAAGVTIDEVLTRSGAPRGSVYYHFPNGRNQILAEALHYAGEAITADIDDAAGQGAKVLIRQFVKFWERVLADSDFNAGCPVVAAAIGSAEDEVPLAAEAARIFAHWRTALTWAFVADGFPNRMPIAIGDVDRRTGRRRRAVPVGPQQRPAAQGLRPARIPGQGKGIRPSQRTARLV